MRGHLNVKLGNSCGSVIRHYPEVFVEELKKSTNNYKTGLLVVQTRFEPIQLLWQTRSVRGYGAYPFSSLAHFLGKRNRK